MIHARPETIYVPFKRSGKSSRTAESVKKGKNRSGDIRRVLTSVKDCNSDAKSANSLAISLGLRSGRSSVHLHVRVSRVSLSRCALCWSPCPLSLSPFLASLSSRPIARDLGTVDRTNEGSAAKIGKETFALFSPAARSGAEKGREESARIAEHENRRGNAENRLGRRQSRCR